MPSNAASSSTLLPPPKVVQVLHVRAKSILSCTFGRSAASSRSGVAPPPSYQTVTVDGVTALLHLSSRDGTVRTVGSVNWGPPGTDEDAAATAGHGARVSVGEHTSDFSDVLRKNKGINRDLTLKSEIRAVHLPGEDASAPLHFQRVAIPTGGFPYTVYTIADMSLPPGPTRAHICVGQLTIKRSPKPRTSTPGNLPAIIPFFSSSRNQARSPATLAPPATGPQPSESGVVVRLELRTRDKELIDRIVLSSLLIVAGKHPIEADKRVELDRPVENEWDAPPALSTLATPQLTPNPSNEHLPSDSSVPPVYQGDYSSDRHLLAPDSIQDMVGVDPFGTPGPGPSTVGMAGHAISVLSVHSSAGSSQSIASAA
ncbi:hypothetical protein FRC07_006326 [Ceratobasidium sp. 392]|nr:hypothetical protein FRC07_006326 [Ceratobasidium sp. 392]